MAMVMKMSLKKWRCAALNFNVLIPSCSIHQNVDNFFSEVEFQKSVKVQEKKEKVLSCVRILHKMWNKEFLCGSSAMTAKK